MATLAYYDVRGLAQPIRFLLAYLKVKFTDKHYTDSKEWFEKDKQGLGLDFPNLPYYIDENIKVTESSAIPIYLIKKNKRNDLLGQNPDGSYNEREVRVQQLTGVLNDIKKEYFPILYNPELYAKKDEVFSTKLQVKLTNLTAYLSNKDFLAGTLSYADFIFYELLTAFRHVFPASITPTLAAYIQRFEALPGIKEYIANPSINLNHFYGKTALWNGP